MTVFDGSNFSEWYERVQFSLGVLDLDLTLITDKPPKATDDSTPEQVEQSKAWAKSNRLGLMFMRMTIANNIKTSLPQTKFTSEFLKSVEERFKRADKSLAGTLMAELTTMKYDGQKGIQQHILNMTKKAAKLKALGMSMDESFLGFLTTRKPKESEKFLYIGNRLKVEVVAVGEKYFIIFIDDLSRYGYVYLMHEKSQAIDIFEMFITEVERQLDKNIKIVRSDRDGEYYGRYDESGQNPGPFAKFLEKCGICAQYTMPAEARIYNPHEKKLDSRMIFGYFIGYPDKSKGYRFYCPNHSVRIVETGNARFLENGEISGKPPQSAPLRRSQRERRPAITDDYVVYLQESDFDIRIRKDPVSFSQAMENGDSSKWMEAMNEELKSMAHNGVWDLIELPNSCKPVDCKWVFKTKRDAKGNIERFKARLVAKGFTQKEGIDYRDTFSPVSKKDSLRIIMTLVTHFDLELHQMDVKTAFLNGNLDEDIYMEQPKGFAKKGNEHLVCKLKKSIYGLKQASRQCDLGLLRETKEHLSKNFHMVNMGEANYVIGIEIFRDRSQGMLGDKLSKMQCPRNNMEMEQMKKIPYASAVGSLMYAQTCTRPDISFVVGMLGRYESDPRFEHWKAAKKVMRYLQGTKDYTLTYKRSEQLEVVGYLDSDYGGCLNSLKSTLGFVFMLANGAIS
ncbi:Retrovirus-related Pol polyprotein from transposon TNT 1-94 [Vitis vinifera]|uniref:Retrovirus-related Pol polyprotein from transposon TNT 1-94 n=1 Tax=Vitis vinifera TaxID=29760 RepID=A0A438E916_VITVI|nr:Retrovirus-related Pol polyprotein from transposon TNT 1-94 [Vitis vinifera]